MVLIAGKSALRLVVKDQSYVGQVRRMVKDYASQIGLSGQVLEKLSIVSTELATNLAKHALEGGEILVFNDSDDEQVVVRLTSIDRGPGIDRVEDALEDGVSTSNTLGGGLGAIRRLSDSFYISTAKGKGTIIQCAFLQKTLRTSNRKNDHLVEIGTFSVAHPAEKNCGDGFATATSNKMTSILVVDGLGHGDLAAEASQRAVETFQNDPFEDARTLVGRMHSHMEGTRGAALALAQIDCETNVLNFVGVGNIASRVYSKYTSTGCVSTQGIIGSNVGTLKQFDYEWHSGDALLMHSDGIRSGAKLDETRLKPATMLAAEIYRDFSRLNDDATVVVVKDKRSE
jgi:anti-sigma regulatory factor (Ser/Thr protein kinase)